MFYGAPARARRFCERNMLSMTEIDISEISTSPVQLIGKQWMLITAGTADDFNCMTASWGGIGFLWNRPVAFVFVRPNRHTVNYIEAQPAFTLSFMPERYRQDLVFCGRNSGRDVDKMAHTGLKPATTPGGLPTFEDAELVLECRKMFRTTLQEADFIDWSEVSPAWYAEDNPLHYLYICEISNALMSESL